MGQRVTFTEQRFGDAAELLARRVLLAMQAGTYNELRDSTLFKQSYSRELAAQVLGIHVGELNEWLLSGVLRGQEITPPRPDNRLGRLFGGHAAEQDALPTPAPAGLGDMPRENGMMSDSQRAQLLLTSEQIRHHLAQGVGEQRQLNSGKGSTIIAAN